MRDPPAVRIRQSGIFWADSGQHLFDDFAEVSSAARILGQDGAAAGNNSEQQRHCVC